MAGITAAGIGSGLDIAALVNQLLSAERAPVEQRIKQARTTFNAQLSALGSIKGALSELWSKSNALAGGGVLGALRATSSLAEAFTATGSTGAVAGSYDIEVVALAKAHKLASDAFVDGSTAVLGNGDVGISVGGAAFTVTLSDGANTLADLRNLINRSTANTGVTATLVNEVGGTRLLLSANDTGTDSEIAVSTSLLAFTEKQAAVDAHIRVDGYNVYAQSNVVSGAIDGVTINLLNTTAGSTGMLSLAADRQAGRTAIEEFVKTYNSLVGLVATQTRYDTGSRKAAPLTGDAAIRGIMQSLRGIVGSAVGGGSFSVLADIGITSKTDGKLVIDTDALDSALAGDRRGVEALFSGTDGHATRLSSVIKQMLDNGGPLDAKTDSVNARLKGLVRQEDALGLRIEAFEARYRMQFAALDSMIAQMQNTSAFLSQQLAGLANLR